MVCLLSSLPTSQKIPQDVNAVLYNFLWDGKADKIKRTEMINNYNKGGLKMIDKFQHISESEMVARLLRFSQ